MNNAPGELARWRFASRLARREVRRRPGRTALVAILVAIPVMAMVIFSVMARTTDREGAFATVYPAGTDLAVTQALNTAVDVSDRIPASASTATVVGGWVPLETADGTVTDYVTVTDGGAGADSSSLFPVGDGVPPGDGEVWVSTDLAAELGVDVGDTLSMRHPAGTWTVAATGRSRNPDDQLAIVIPDLPVEQFRDGSLYQRTFVDLPGEASVSDLAPVAADLGELVEREDGSGAVVWSGQDDDTGQQDVEPLAWGWVGGVLALAATGIIVAAAFATSARRQLVTIGLLSSNGAPERLMRRTLALQGLWTGVVGSLAGVAGGVVAVLAGRSTIERIGDTVLNPYVFSTPDLLVIVATGIAAATVAALVPARSASRVPVLAALAGRRPMSDVPRRLVPIGLALFALGVFLMVVGASTEGGNAAASAAVLGGVSVLAGMCCCSPLAIDAMSNASARLGSSWRFAGRSLGRTRTRSAAVVTAIAVTAAFAAAGSAAALTIDEGASQRQFPSDAVVVVPHYHWPAEDGGVIDVAPSVERPLEESLQEAIDDAVPSATWHTRRVATWDPPSRRIDSAIAGQLPFLDLEVVIADDAMMDLYELSETDRQTLASTGALAINAWIIVDRSGPEGGSWTTATEDGDVTIEVAFREQVADQLMENGGRDATTGGDEVTGIDGLMMTEEAARAAGLDIVVRGGFLRSAAALTDLQVRQVDRAVNNDRERIGSVYRDVPEPTESSGWRVVMDRPSWQLPALAIQGGLIGTALLLTLLVVAIGLSLAATESRDERDVLVAVGARPATMRSMAGVKAAVITLTGVVLAVPTGLVPMAAMMHARHQRFEFPWLAVGALVLLVPLLAGAAAWLVSIVAQTTRPVRMSNLAFD